MKWQDKKNLTQKRKGAKKMQGNTRAIIDLPAALNENEIARMIVDAAYNIHQRMGPGLLESVYEIILAYELRKKGLTVDRQVPMEIIWENVRFEEGFRGDLIVWNTR